MKKYRLLKDLPGLKAGVIFEQLQNSMYCNKDGIDSNSIDHYDFKFEIVESSLNWFEAIKEKEVNK